MAHSARQHPPSAVQRSTSSVSAAGATSRVQKMQSLRMMGYAEQSAALDPNTPVQAKGSSGAAPVQFGFWGDVAGALLPGYGAAKDAARKMTSAAEAAKQPPEEGVPEIIGQVEGALSMIEDSIEAGREAGVDIQKLPPAIRKVHGGLKLIKKYEDAVAVWDSVSNWYAATSEWDAFVANPGDTGARIRAAGAMGDFISSVGKLGSFLPPPLDEVFGVLEAFDRDFFVGVSANIDPRQKPSTRSVCEQYANTGDLDGLICGD